MLGIDGGAQLSPGALHQVASDLRILRDLLTTWRDSLPKSDPRGRDLSLAITDIESAILRLRHGTPL